MGGRNKAVSIIMFEIRAIIQWNKDIKNDVGSWKSALVLRLEFLFSHVTKWHWVGNGRKEGGDYCTNLMLTGFIN